MDLTVWGGPCLQVWGEPQRGFQGRQTVWNQNGFGPSGLTLAELPNTSGFIPPLHEDFPAHQLRLLPPRSHAALGRAHQQALIKIQLIKTHDSHTVRRGSSFTYFPGKLMLPQGRGSQLGRLEGLCVTAICISSYGVSLPVDLWVRVSQLLLNVRAQPAPCPGLPSAPSCPGLVSRTQDEPLPAVPAGPAAWHQVIQPPPVLWLLSRQEKPHGMGTQAAPAKPARDASSIPVRKTSAIRLEPALRGSWSWSLAAGSGVDVAGECWHPSALELGLWEQRTLVVLPVMAEEAGGTQRKQGRSPIVAPSPARTHKWCPPCLGYILCMWIFVTPQDNAASLAHLD